MRQVKFDEGIDIEAKYDTGWLVWSNCISAMDLERDFKSYFVENKMLNKFKIIMFC